MMLSVHQYVLCCVCDVVRVVCWRACCVCCMMWVVRCVVYTAMRYVNQFPYVVCGVSYATWCMSSVVLCMTCMLCEVCGVVWCMWCTMYDAWLKVGTIYTVLWYI